MLFRDRGDAGRRLAAHLDDSARRRHQRRRTASRGRSSGRGHGGRLHTAQRALLCENRLAVVTGAATRGTTVTAPRLVNPCGTHPR